MAKRLRRASRKTGKRRSLRDIAEELARVGYVNDHGQPFGAQSILNMIEADQPKRLKLTSQGRST